MVLNEISVESLAQSIGAPEPALRLLISLLICEYVCGNALQLCKCAFSFLQFVIIPTELYVWTSNVQIYLVSLILKTH